MFWQIYNLTKTSSTVKVKNIQQADHFHVNLDILWCLVASKIYSNCYHGEQVGFLLVF